MMFLAITEDGRYGLKDNGELWRINADPANDYMAGYVLNPTNIEDAAEAADEEMGSLIADAREEFGIPEATALIRDAREEEVI